ncbi:protein gone early [Euwallacea fornicatus]|uniref:protein gone early n=1 Tax=Euwallacea fornicatus TaxID=995702 RepID=UPI00338F3BE5
MSTKEALSIDPETLKNNGSTLAKNCQLDDSKVDSTGNTEIDPCLNQLNDSKPKKTPLHEKCILNLQLRTGLSRKWVLVFGSLVALCAVFILVILGLTVAWPRVPHIFGYGLCRNPACLRAASQIQENLDPLVSPCSNLWQAVCSQYDKTATPLERPVWNQKEMLVLNELEKIRNVISTLELPLRPGTVTWKMKHFYEACLDVDTIAIDRARPLTTIISELGGWYILRDWTDIDFNGMEVLSKLQVRYGVSPFFRVHVEPDPRTPNAHSMIISPSGLGLPDRDYYFRDSEDKVLLAYMGYIRDVVISLSSSRNEAAKFAKDIFNYEKRIAEVTPDAALLCNPIKRNSTALEHLKITTSTIPFYDILQEIYSEITVSETTEVIVTSQEYLDEVAQIISSTDRRTLNGYLIWTLVRQYLPYLSDIYTSSVNSFYFELYGAPKSTKRWELCASLVRKYMPLATEYHLEKSHPVTQETRDTLNATFRLILGIVKEKLHTFARSSHLQMHLADKLNTIKLHIGLPESAKTALFLRDFYSPLKIIKLDLFEGVKSAITLRRRIEEKMLLNALPEGIVLRELMAETPQIKYIPSKNMVVIPRSLVVEPLFEDGVPRPIFYGRLGAQLAFAILSAILPYGSFWTSENKMLSPFHTQPTESFNSILPDINCLSRYIDDSNTTSVSQSKLSEGALLLVKELTAIRIGNEALLAASRTEPHVHYSGVDQYEDSALYFLSYAQTICEVSTSQYDLFQSIVNFKVPAKLRMELIWSQLPEMRNSFDCSGTTLKSCLKAV